MKRIFSLILLLVSTCAVASAQPQSAAVKGKPAAGRDSGEAFERLFEKYVAALGGVESLLKIRTRTTRGTVELSTSNVHGTFESYTKAPNKSLELVNAPGLGQLIQAYDGRRGWLQSPWAGALTVDGKAVEGLRRSAAFGTRGFRWSSLFSSSKLKGREEVEGRSVVVAEVTPFGRRPQLMYFDAATGLLLKLELIQPGPPQTNTLRAICYDAYTEVDGVKLPTVFRHVYTEFTLTFRLYEVKNNVPIEDALFDSPQGR
jgi:hypothetical protein